MSDPIKLGVVGGGLVAQAAHLPALATMPERFALEAIAEPDERLGAALCRRFGIGRHWADAEELIASRSVEAILVCSPNATHGPLVLRALDAGLHVFVEKPLCLSVADADAIAAARRGSGLVVQVGYMKRFDAAYEALVADAPAAEAIQHVEVLTYDPRFPRFFRPGEILAARPPAPAQVARLAAAEREQIRAALGRNPGGADAQAAYSLIFLGALVHDVNVVHGVLEAAGHAGGVEVVDAWWRIGRGAGGTARLANGATWTTTWLDLPGAYDFQERIVFYADDGVRELRLAAPYSLLRKEGSVYRRSHGQQDLQLARELRTLGSSFERELEHFHDCVRAGAACRTPPEQARTDVDLLARMFACATETAPRQAVAAPDPASRHGVA